MNQNKTLLAASICAALAAGSAQAATFNVTTNADSGAGSLRQALIDAGANAEADVIELSAISGQTIALSSGALYAAEDEITVNAALKRGDIEAAKQLIMTLAPPYDPEAVDEKGRRPKKPVPHIAHLRARAQVYVALKEYDKALADAEEIYSRQYAADSGMSQRTKELDEAEALRDEILRLGKPKAD